MFKEIFIDEFKEGASGIFLGIMLWLLAIVIVGLILGLCFYAVDSIGLTTEERNGNVIDKEFCPGHYQSNGKTNYWVSDDWTLSVSFGDDESNGSVSKEFYKNIRVGDAVICGVANGRLSNCLYIKYFKKNQNGATRTDPR